MKKFLAGLLAVMMILSAVATMIVSVSASASAASNTPNSIVVSEGEDAAQNFYDPATPGWSMTNNSNGDNTYKVVEIVTGKETEKAVGDVITGPAEFPVIGYRFHYWMDGTLDISGMKYVEFDLYLTDAEAYQGKTMIVELSSAGIDAEEISFEAKYPLKDGWNHIRLSIPENFTGKNGEIKKNAWKFCRVFFNSEDVVTVADGEEFIIAIDNLEFNNGLTNGGAEVAPHSVTLSNANASVDGWDWTGNASLKCDDDASNTGSISKIFLPGEKIPFPGIITYYDLDEIGGDMPTSYDVSAATKFKFEFYTSNAELVGDIPFEIELTSGGICDSEEIAWSQVKLGDFVEGGLKDGWNTIVLEMIPKMESDKRDFDPTRWNWFRLFNMKESAAPEGLTVAIDNVRFENDEGEVIQWVSDCNPDMKGWGGSVGAMNIPKVTGTDEETGEDVTTMQATMGAIYTANVAASGGLQITYTNPDNSGLNITGMKFLEFDLYVTDAAALINSGNIVIELASGGICDKEEIAYKVYGNNESLGIKDGWNRVSIPLSLFTGVTGGTFQWTYLNYLRIYNENAITVNGELTVAIDNVTLWDGQSDLKTSARGDVLQARETITAAAGATEFEFVVANAATAKGAIFTAQLSGRVEISVSTDGMSWSEVYTFADAKAENGLATAVRAYDLTEYVVDDEGFLLGDTVYVKVAGNVGGDNVALDVVYDIPEFETTDNYSFTIGTSAEEKYLVEGANINAEKTVRFADQNAQIVYKFDLDRTTNFESMSLSIPLQGQYVVSASTDGKTWTEVLRWDGEEGGANGPSTATTKLIDLSKAIELVGTIEAVYIRITDADTSNGYGGAIPNTAPVILSVGYFDASAVKHNKIAFTILSEGEKAYLLEQKANDLDTSRFADAAAYWTYKYELSDLEGVRSITWTAMISAQYHIQASADGSNWIDIGKSTATADKALRNFDASALISEVTETGTLYIKIGDADTSNGNGGRVWNDAPITLDVAFIPLTDAQKDALEMMEDEHKKPLDGFNSLWSNDAYVVDFDNATAGSACLSIDLEKKMVVSSISLDAPVNGEGMDTLQFELYLSDLAILDEFRFGAGASIEITSGGTADQGEKNYELDKILDALKSSGEAKVGWNSIAIKLSDMGETDTTGVTPFDITAINYVRIFWTAATLPTTTYTIKFDNLRLTDKEAEDKAALERAVEEFKANNADFIEAIKALDAYKTSKNITAENYETAKAEINAVRARLEAYSAEEQKICEDAGFTSYLTKAEKSLEKYEETLAKIEAAMEENKDLVDKINGLTTTITSDNYEAQKAAAEEARAAYDKLTKTVKGYFEDKGLTEKLEAAEAAIEAFDPTKPPVTTECEHADADADGKCDKCGKDMGTTPPTTGDNTGDNTGDTDGGCKSALTIGAVAMMVLAGAWVTIAARKKD